MAARPPENKEEALKAIAHAWEELNTALDTLTEEQATTILDTQGWSAKDHISHLTAWERSVVFLLQGKPRHEGLGVDEELYLGGDDDTINAAVYSQTKDLPLDEARQMSHFTHQQLSKLLEPMSEDDLSKPYSHFLPDEPGENRERPIYSVILGNTLGHFKEHLGWIQELVETEAPTGE